MSGSQGQGIGFDGVGLVDGILLIILLFLLIFGSTDIATLTGAPD